MTIDYKKTEKHLYQPKATPSIVDVPTMTYIAIDGKGNPNTSEAYRTAIEILYGLSYSIKMSKMSGATPTGYFEYVVPPLEGLWWSVDTLNKDGFCWTSMIRQPEFVTPKVFDTAKIALSKKKPTLDLSKASLISITEGLCVQAMHVGSYEEESKTIAVMEKYILENGYALELNDARRHHEIYLSDPRKVAPEKLKTVIRLPIKKEKN